MNSDATQGFATLREAMRELARRREAEAQKQALFDRDGVSIKRAPSKPPHRISAKALGRDYHQW
jgi:hypothetical protein